MHKILCDEAIEGYSCCLKKGWHKIIFYKKGKYVVHFVEVYIDADAWEQYNPTNKLTTLDLLNKIMPMKISNKKKFYKINFPNFMCMHVKLCTERAQGRVKIF